VDVYVDVAKRSTKRGVGPNCRIDHIVRLLVTPT
jgi:hypothetical protein